MQNIAANAIAIPVHLHLRMPFLPFWSKHTISRCFFAGQLRLSVFLVRLCHRELVSLALGDPVSQVYRSGSEAPSKNESGISTPEPERSIKRAQRCVYLRRAYAAVALELNAAWSRSEERFNSADRCDKPPWSP
jgi:hypothetical protein